MKRIWHKLFGHPRGAIHFNRERNLFVCDCGYSVKWLMNFEGISRG